MDDNTTTVIFRKFRDKSGDILALFPYIPADPHGLTCESYMHTGQHGAADPNIVYRTRRATPEEYADLKRELEAPPYEYRFRVMQRTPKDAADVRRREARR